ncbi:hypothetical protein [Bosea beijingensis]|uniref:hypothetical protein n=1 Tax=Bosea beijingensis TaxID=3068632 RepID=UPI002742766E|nr:hypothetical protein [Bosea sp. REN20]
MSASQKTETDFDRARERVEGHLSDRDGKGDKLTPPDGPHATEGATDKAKTPGSGALSSSRPRDDIETGTG